MGLGGVAIATLPSVICAKLMFSDGLGGAVKSGQNGDFAIIVWAKFLLVLADGCSCAFYGGVRNSKILCFSQVKFGHGFLFGTAIYDGSVEVGRRVVGSQLYGFVEVVEGELVFAAFHLECSPHFIKRG